MPPQQDEGLPSKDEDDVEAPKKVPPIKGIHRREDDDDATAPLLSDTSRGKHTASDEAEGPKTPRDKFRQLSATTPRDTTSAAAPAAAPAAEGANGAAAAASAGAATGAPPFAAAPPPGLTRYRTSQELLHDLMADAPPPLTKLPEAKRMEVYIDSLAQNTDGGGPSGIVTALKPCLLIVIRVCIACGPWVSFLVKWGKIIWAWMPANMVQMIFGGGLCYFGGTFTASIAAVEAFRTMGFEKAHHDVAALTEQLDKVAQMNDEDDAADDDGDGIADVEQVSPAELVRRKVILIMCV